MKISFENIYKKALNIVLPILIYSIVLYVLFVLAIHGLSDKSLKNSVDAFTMSGSLGDTINGILAPVIGITAVITTFLAFLIQYEANQKITDQFKIERFENKFYEMLKVHKDNVSEINIDDKYHGRKSFVWMYKEFRFIYQITYKCYFKLLDERLKEDEKALENFSYNTKQLTELSYVVFFFGVGEVSNKGVEYFTPNFDNLLVQEILSELKNVRNNYLKKQSKKNKWIKLKSPTFKKGVTIIYINFEPFDGHVAKLGHYFRHLYQLIKLVTTDPIWDENDSKKESKRRYSYVKQIRVQLSNHEQAMIYYNSFFNAGNVWWGDDSIKKSVTVNGKEHDLSYFLDYSMIKNIPFNLTDGIGPHPVEEFFENLMKRGYDLDKKEEKEIIREKLSDKLFEWGMKDEFFEKLVSNYQNSKLQ